MIGENLIILGSTELEDKLEDKQKQRKRGITDDYKNTI